MKKIFYWTSLLLVLAILSGCSSSKGKVTIGGKNFTEQDILVELMKQTIEAKTDVEVVTKPFLGGTAIVSDALERGDLDIYAEYTGTALLHLLKLPPESDPEKSYQIVKDQYTANRQAVWLKPLGFNNTYTLTMRKDQAQELGITKISDLTPLSPQLRLGAEPEFIERPDGYPGLQKMYGLNFSKVSSLEAGLMYAACRDGQVDVIDAFATDGRIPAFNLQVLEDDKNFFPSYQAAPVVRKDTLKKYPEIETALNLLAGKLTDSEMARLNAQVDLDKRSAKDVANTWLKEQGIVK